MDDECVIDGNPGVDATNVNTTKNYIYNPNTAPENHKFVYSIERFLCFFPMAGTTGIAVKHESVCVCFVKFFSRTR